MIFLRQVQTTETRQPPCEGTPVELWIVGAGGATSFPILGEMQRAVKDVSTGRNGCLEHDRATDLLPLCCRALCSQGPDPMLDEAAFPPPAQPFVQGDGDSAQLVTELAGTPATVPADLLLPLRWDPMSLEAGIESRTQQRVVGNSKELGSNGPSLQPAKEMRLINEPSQEPATPVVVPLNDSELLNVAKMTLPEESTALRSFAEAVQCKLPTPLPNGLCARQDAKQLRPHQLWSYRNVASDKQSRRWQTSLQPDMLRSCCPSAWTWCQRQTIVAKRPGRLVRSTLGARICPSLVGRL
jgi:hypothetical protein